MDAYPTVVPRIVHVQPAGLIYPKPVEYAHLQHPITEKDRTDRRRFEEFQRHLANRGIREVIRSLRSRNSRPKNCNELASILVKMSMDVGTFKL